MHCNLPKAAWNPHRFNVSTLRRRGTTLIEVLVVIVVFLVGILAVAQVFPGGTKILNRTRSQSQANSLAHSEIERLTSRPDLLPDRIIAVRYVGGQGPLYAVEHPEKSPTDYVPTGAGIDNLGNLLDAGGASLGNWQLHAGANAIRRVIGESHQIPAPRYLSGTTDTSAALGGLVMAEYGPIDFDPVNPVALTVYGRNQLLRTGALPASGIRPYEAYTVDETLPTTTVTLPVNTNIADPVTQWRFTFTMIVDGAPVHVTDYLVSLAPDASGARATLLSSLPGLVPLGGTFQGLVPNTLRIARAFRQLDITDPFTSDVFEYKLVDSRLGILLFNPAGYNFFEQRPGFGRLPLVAKLNYDVRDWRILREDFRIPSTFPGYIKLSLNSLAVSSDPSPDSRSVGAFDATLDPNNILLNNVGQHVSADNMVLIDTDTGGVIAEEFGGRRVVTVQKGTGNVTIENAGAGTVFQIAVTLPGATGPVLVDGADRPIRILYRAKGQWAVQMLCAAKQYDRVFGAPFSGQYAEATAVGGMFGRLYFPRIDVGRRIVIGKLKYRYTDGGGVVRNEEVNGVELTIRNAPEIATPMGMVDLFDAVEGPNVLRQTPGVIVTDVQDVRGASFATRVFWNLGVFSLSDTPFNNLHTRFAQYMREWSINTKETFVSRGESIQ